MNADQELEDHAEIRRSRRKCCPNCVGAYKDSDLDAGVCRDGKCLCHHPLRFAVKDESKVTAKFGG